MKTWKLFLGLGFILLAVALVLDALGVLAPILGIVGGVSVFALLGGLLLLCYTVVQICRLKFGEIFLPLAFIFMIFEKNIAYIFKIGDENGNIINNWLLLLCAGMLWIGFSILFSGIRRKRRRKKCRAEFEINGISHGSFGSSVKYIDCTDFEYTSVENNMGSCVIFFENTEKYEGGGVLDIENNLGTVVVNVPSDWNVIVNIDNSLGSVSEPKPYPGGPTLTFKGDNNLGSISFKTV